MLSAICRQHYPLNIGRLETLELKNVIRPKTLLRTFKWTDFPVIDINTSKSMYFTHVFSYIPMIHNSTHYGK